MFMVRRGHDPDMSWQGMHMQVVDDPVRPCLGGQWCVVIECKRPPGLLPVQMWNGAARPENVHYAVRELDRWRLRTFRGRVMATG